jgi:hypothetical protein
MADLERELGPPKGAKFFRDGEDVMFTFGVDPNNIIGPRIATRLDQATYPAEWTAFLEGQHKPQLDRDGDGRPGGSLPDASKKNRGGRPRKNPL